MEQMEIRLKSGQLISKDNDDNDDNDDDDDDDDD